MFTERKRDWEEQGLVTKKRKMVAQDSRLIGIVEHFLLRY
jgi:hypothetical protein